MSHESVPEHPGQDGQAAHDRARPQSAAPAPGGAPKGLLQQMEELMAALNADLSQLDADLQSSADRTPSAPGTAGTAGALGAPAAPGPSVTSGSGALESERPSSRSL